MTRDEIVAIIKQRMGNYIDSTLDAHIVTEMKLAQINLEQEATLPWFLVVGGSGSGTADNGVVTDIVASRGGTDCAFLAEYEEENAAIYLASETFATRSYMGKEDYVTLFEAVKNSQLTYDSSNSRRYYALNPASEPSGTFEVFPAPSEAWTFYIRAYFADVPLTTDITNLWLTHASDLIIGYVGRIIAGNYTVLEKFVPAFTDQESKARTRLSKVNALKAEENIRRMMGDS